MACWLFPALTLAAPNVRTVRLEYHRAAEATACPDESALRSAVASRLGFEPFDGEALASLSVTVRPAASGGFDATLELTDEVGAKKTRSLSGARADCRDLSDALALSLSVALEAFTAAPAPPLEPPTEVKPVEPPPAKPAPPEVRGEAVPTLTFGGALALGLAPTPTGVLWLGGGFRHGTHFSLGGEVRFLTPTGINFEMGRIDVASVSVDVMPCLSLLPVRGCFIGSGGVMWSWATNLSGARSAVTPIAQLGGRVDLSFHLAWKLWLVVLAELRGALALTSLRVGTTQVWVTPPVSGVVGLALELRFPPAAVTDPARGDK